MTIKAFYKDRRYFHHSRIPVYADNDEYITGYILRMDALQLMAEDKYDKTLGDIRRNVDSFQRVTLTDQEKGVRGRIHGLLLLVLSTTISFRKNIFLRRGRPSATLCLMLPHPSTTPSSTSSASAR